MYSGGICPFQRRVGGIFRILQRGRYLTAPSRVSPCCTCLRLETYTRVNTVKSVATAVSTRSMAPKMIPLLLKANGSERTPPPVFNVEPARALHTHIRQMAQREEVAPPAPPVFSKR